MKSVFWAAIAAILAGAPTLAASPVPSNFPSNVGNVAFNVVHYIQEGVRVFDDNGKPSCFHFSYLFENPRDVYIPLHEGIDGYKQGKWSSELFEENRLGRFSIEFRRGPDGKSLLSAKTRLEGGSEQSFVTELAPGQERAFRRRTLISVAPDCTRSLLTIGPVSGS